MPKSPYSHQIWKKQGTWILPKATGGRVAMLTDLDIVDSRSVRVHIFVVLRNFVDLSENTIFLFFFFYGDNLWQQPSETSKIIEQTFQLLPDKGETQFATWVQPT